MFRILWIRSMSMYFKVFLKDVKQIINACNLMMLMNPSKFIMFLDVNNLYGWVMS